MNPSDLSVCIRSVGERTEGLCRQSFISQGVPEENIEVVTGVPFWKVQVASCEMALRRPGPWCVFADSDIVMAPDALEAVLDGIERRCSGDDWLAYQPVVHDAVYGGYVLSGIHVYRSDKLKTAVDFIPQSRSLRPESTMIKRMIGEFGLKVRVDTSVVAGVHGYGQFYKDIFRTYLVKGMKSSPAAIDHIRRHCERDDLEHAEARHILAGLELGVSRRGTHDDVDVVDLAEAYSAEIDERPLISDDDLKEAWGAFYPWQDMPTNPSPLFSAPDILDREWIRATGRSPGLLRRLLVRLVGR